MANSAEALGARDTTLWFVADRGQVLGPLLESTIAERLRSGQLSGSAQLWRHGLMGWEPIGVHFPSHFAGPGRPSDTASNGVAPSEPASLPSLKVRWLPILGAVLAGASFYALKDELLDLVAPPWIAAIWAGVILVILGLGMLAMVKWWRYAARRARASPAPHLWGMIKLACALVGIALIGGGIFASTIATLVYRVAVARQAFDNYRIAVNAAGDTIVIEGVIGPGFARRLDQMLTRDAGVRRIAITSQGGLTDEGLRAAAAIGRHPGIGVVARKECNSTCIILLLAGTKSYADWDMVLGFHAVSAILGDQSVVMKTALQRAEAPYDRYLRDHHVSSAIIDEMYRIGPGSALFVPAIKLSDTGVLTGLLAGDTPVTLTQAKWLWIEGFVKRHVPFWSREPISASYRAVWLQAQFTADRYAKALYTQLQEKDFSRFEYTASTMMSELVAAAIGAADVRELASYLGAVHGELTRLAAASDWTACRALLEARAFVTPRRLPAYLLWNYGAALAALLRSANAAHWKMPATTAGAELSALEFLAQARMIVAADGVLVAQGSRSARGRCLIARETFGLLAAAPVEDARLALGWLGRYDRL